MQFLATKKINVMFTTIYPCLVNDTNSRNRKTSHMARTITSSLYFSLEKLVQKVTLSSGKKEVQEKIYALKMPSSRVRMNAKG